MCSLSSDDRQRLAIRTAALQFHGATGADREQLLAYNERRFDHDTLAFPLAFPLASEPHLAAWRAYIEEAGERPVFPVLQDKLVQLQFPIEQGISNSDAYRAATRRGIVAKRDQSVGLELLRPADITLTLHLSLAGEIPVLVIPERADFITVVQALTQRNEPTAIPDSMGAAMVAGLNNWDRVRQYRVEWENTHAGEVTEYAWNTAFSQMVPRKELYQDRLILLSDGPYSGVAANPLSLDDDVWRKCSLHIRREHESTHYFTQRVLGSMRNHLLDELLADYQGIVAANGAFRVDWLLHFMGLENEDRHREGGRLQNYCGDPPFSETAFAVLQNLVRAAAENLATFDAQLDKAHATPLGQALTLLSISYFTIEELATADSPDRLRHLLNKLESRQAEKTGSG